MSWFSRKNDIIKLGDLSPTETQPDSKNEARVHEVSREDEAAMERTASPREKEPVTWEAFDLKAIAEKGAERNSQTIKKWGNRIKLGWGLARALPDVGRVAGNIARDQVREKSQAAWSAVVEGYDNAKGEAMDTVAAMQAGADEAWTGAREWCGEKRRAVVEGWRSGVQAIVDKGVEIHTAYQKRQAEIALDARHRQQVLEKENAVAEFQACLRRIEELDQKYGLRNSPEGAAA
jgi:hypothetical protein